MKIEDLPKEERPREKASIYGIESLNNRELLAIILRTGYKGKSALDLADDLLKEFGSLSNLMQSSSKRLAKIKGISSSKALLILSISEVAKRERQSLQKRFDSSFDVYDSYRNRWDESEQEEAILLCFNRRKYLISEQRLSLGNYNMIHLSRADVISRVLREESRQFILLHNHPSGISLPSKEDVSFTIALDNESKRMGLTLLDHIIVGEGDYFSFRDEKLLSN